MLQGHRVAVVIPACDEAASIAKVIGEIPTWVDQIVVCDNASADDTAERAKAAGATVVHEERPGYGAACLKAIDALDAPDIVVFLDGDYSDYPEEMLALADPIARDEADFVLGSRKLGRAARGALTPQQRIGNGLACALIRILWGHRYTDLGPFRAIRFSDLMELGMNDQTWGWTVEMQVKAVKRGLRVREAPVRYRRRIGKSKISGTVLGVVKAGAKILWTIAVEAVKPERRVTPNERAVMFTRFPKAGEAKTRLIPALGAQKAADLHAQMAQHTAQCMRRALRPETASEVRFTGTQRPAMRAWLGPDLAYVEQGSGDLGERIFRAMEAALPEAERTVVIGTDCPALTDRHIRNAFALLQNHDLVLGPAADGGYYLIGMQYPLRELFEGIAWGTSEVFEKTRTKAERLGLRTAVLETLADVDTQEDLVHWEAHGPEVNGEPRKLSVIVPAWNEEACIARTLAGIGQCRGVEIIVADGGSGDQTAVIAKTYGAHVLRSERGRAEQMNAAAAQARGDLLLFVHADTVLPPRYKEQVVQALSTPGVVAAAFRLRVDGPGKVLRIVERIANFRSVWRQLPYGDQALAVRADVFRAEGGFRPLPIMEDFELVQRLRRRGRVTLMPAAVLTSARRWEETGPLRLTFKHQRIILGWQMGVPAERLAKWR